MKKIYLLLVVSAILIITVFLFVRSLNLFSVMPNAQGAFEYLGAGYAKDNKRVYYTKLIAPIEEDMTSYLIAIKDKKNYQIVSGADAKSFAVLDLWYAKDKENVYCGLNNIKADPKSFKVLTDHGYTRGQDKNGTYDCYGQISVAGNELVPLSFYYRKDNEHVYYGSNSNEIVESADPKTFEVINTYEGKDSKWLYAYGKKVNIDNIDTATYQYLTDFYSKDKNRVYTQSGVLTGADPNSFVALSHRGYSKDNNSAFYMGSKLNGADAPSFSDLSQVYAIDKNNIYCKNFIIKGVDRDSFKASDNGAASDKYRTYDFSKCEEYSK